MTLPARPTESAAEAAYSTILDAILRGRYRADEMLSEATLAIEIGVSRTPVRTALARLQDEGWVSIYPKRGALVRGLSERSTGDLAAAKLLFESGSIQACAPHTLRQLATRLDTELGAQQTALEAEDLGRFVELSIRFHRALVEVGDNPLILELYDRLADRQRYLLFAHGRRVLDRCDEIVAEHAAMLAHLRSGNVDNVTLALRTHLDESFGGSL